MATRNSYDDERNPEADLAELRSEYRYEDDDRYQMSDAEAEYRAARLLGYADDEPIPYTLTEEGEAAREHEAPEETVELTPQGKWALAVELLERAARLIGVPTTQEELAAYLEARRQYDYDAACHECGGYGWVSAKAHGVFFRDPCSQCGGTGRTSHGERSTNTQGSVEYPFQ